MNTFGKHALAWSGGLLLACMLLLQVLPAPEDRLREEPLAASRYAADRLGVVCNDLRMRLQEAAENPADMTELLSDGLPAQSLTGIVLAPHEASAAAAYRTRDSRQFGRTVHINTSVGKWRQAQAAFDYGVAAYMYYYGENGLRILTYHFNGRQNDVALSEYAALDREFDPMDAFWPEDPWLSARLRRAPSLDREELTQTQCAAAHAGYSGDFMR